MQGIFVAFGRIWRGSREKSLEFFKERFRGQEKKRPHKKTKAPPILSIHDPSRAGKTNTNLAGAKNRIGAPTKTII